MAAETAVDDAGRGGADDHADLFSQIEPVAVVEIIRRPDGSIDVEQTVTDDEALQMIAWATSIITVWRQLPDPVWFGFDEDDDDEDEEEDD